MGSHSGPYPTQDPNKSDEVIDVEAALAYSKLRRGEHPDDICKQLGLSRRTFYRRIETLILAQERPSRRLMQAMEFDTLQDLTRRVYERLEDESSTADFAKLVGESRQLSAARRALLRLDDDPDDKEEPQDDEELAEWVAEAEADSGAELRSVREYPGRSA